MDSDPQANEVWLRLGPTTRARMLTSGETIKFAREALDKAVEDIKSTFLPQIVEHLNYLPPVGRIVDMRVEESGGDAFLLGLPRRMMRRDADDLVFPAQDSGQGAERIAEVAPDRGDLAVSLEPRNFEPLDLEFLESEAPLSVKHHAMHSALPPVIWMLTAGGVWTGVKFADSFVAALGDALGHGLVEWLTRAGRRVKEPDREQLVEARLRTASGVEVLAICPFTPESGASVEALRAGLSALGDVALYCAALDSGDPPPAMKQAAFMWDGEHWRLAWWASNDASYVTPWFRENAPDPERFLGRPNYAGIEALDYMLSSGGVSLGGTLAVSAGDAEPD